jgi:sugar/nucleoside kinase (ribokinase family)
MKDDRDNKFESQSFDVLGLGCAAVDDLLYVPSFPAADAKVRVERSARRCGGLTGAALVAAARQGARCAYAGCLGTDELSQYVADDFAREGISTAPAPRLPGAGVVRSVIVVGRDTGSRNIFFQTEGLLGAHDSLPAEEVIRSARVLFIDHYGMRGNLRAARLARAHGVAVVADFEDASAPVFKEVLRLVDHLILSKTFALSITGQPDAPRAALALWRPDRVAVVVTCGAQGCWSVSPGAKPAACHHGAFPIKAADTTGCGDVFHGAYAARLARAEPLDNCLRFAAAAAALKAMGNEIPRLAEVEAFLGRNPV